jgi:LCP family protein required for cell wall assembly
MKPSKPPRIPAMRRKGPGLGQKILVLGISIVILIIGVLIGWFYMKYRAMNTSNSNGNSPIELPTPTPGERTNFLFIGVDARPEEIESGFEARSDTIIYGSLDPSVPEAFLLSIPRDSLVDIPGYGQDKVNASLSFGGIQLLSETVSQLVTKPIHYYIEVNFDGFSKAIDILGGIDLNVEERMYYPWEEIDLYPGLQHLDGTQSLAYVRYRGYPEGDIARVQKQQKFITALIDQHFTLSNVGKIPAIFDQISSYMKTNLPVDEAIKLAKVFASLRMNEIRMEIVPGEFYDEPVTGTSYWAVNQPALVQLMQTLEEPWATESITPTTAGIPSDSEEMGTFPVIDATQPASETLIEPGSAIP